jgi:hypothetical protein
MSVFDSWGPIFPSKAGLILPIAAELVEDATMLPLARLYDPAGCALIFA